MPTPTPSASSRSSTAILAVLVNNVIGAGLLALPYTFKRASLVPGVAALALTGCLNLGGVLLLARCCALTGASSYKDLVLAAWGQRAAAGAAVLLALYTAGSCVSYLVLLGDALPELVHFAGDGGPLPRVTAFFSSGEVVVPLATVAVILPLSLLRDLSSLRFTSIASFVIIVYTALLVFAKGASGTHASDVIELHGGAGMFVGLPISLVAFTCHYNVPRFYAELAETGAAAASSGPPPSSSKPRAFALLSLAAYAFTLVVYESTATCGYLLFGSGTKGDVLENFANNDVPVVVARIGLVLLQLFSFPIVFNSHRASVAALLPHTWQKRLEEGPSRLAASWQQALGAKGSVRRGGAVDVQPLLRSGGGGGGVVDEHNSDGGDVVAPASCSLRVRYAFLFLSTEWPHILLTIALLFLSVFLALVLPDLAAVLGYKGALGGTLIVYALPSAMNFIFTHRAAAAAERRGGRAGSGRSVGTPGSLYGGGGRSFSGPSSSPGADSVSSSTYSVGGGEEGEGNGLINTDRAPTPLLWASPVGGEGGGWDGTDGDNDHASVRLVSIKAEMANPSPPLRGAVLVRALTTTSHGLIALALCAWCGVVMVLGVLTTAGLLT